jgi:hypothetical protein
MSSPRCIPPNLAQEPSLSCIILLPFIPVVQDRLSVLANVIAPVSKIIPATLDTSTTFFFMVIVLKNKKFRVTQAVYSSTLNQS